MKKLFRGRNGLLELFPGGNVGGYAENFNFAGSHLLIEISNTGDYAFGNHALELVVVGITYEAFGEADFGIGAAGEGAVYERVNGVLDRGGVIGIEGGNIGVRIRRNYVLSISKEPSLLIPAQY